MDGATADKVEPYLPDSSLNLGGVKSTVSATINQSLIDPIAFAGSINAPGADHYNIDEIRLGASYAGVVPVGAPTATD